MSGYRRIFAVLGVGVLAVIAAGGIDRAQDDPGGEPRTIEVAICLDSSGSMKPLIDAARLSLWDVVNELSQVRPVPTVRVALLGFGGRAEGGPQSGWVKVRAPLTEDLDQVSAQLFEMTTGGGTEYVGRVLQTALDGLAWSEPGEDTLRMIFVAGNEPADQDPEVDFREMAADALEREFELYVVYCGQETDPHAATWKELAETAEGRFATLDLRAASSVVGTSVDREMARLGTELNRTYVGLGEQGKTGLKAVEAQDQKVEALGLAAAAARAETKAGALYGRNWDLIDSIASGRTSLDEIEPTSLPKVMRGMTPDERSAYVETVRGERERIRRQILDLSAQRRRLVAEQAKKSGLDSSKTFDGIVRGAILQELGDRGYEAEGK